MDNNTLGKRIAELRRSKELKQDDLAQMLNISPQAVSKWENDQTCPDISLLPELAKILSVSVDELLSGRSEPITQLVPLENRKDINTMTLKIEVISDDDDKIRINLPMPLVKMAAEIGLAMPQISGNDALKNIDLNKIMDLVAQGVVGNIIDIESNGNTVKIYVE